MESNESQSDTYNDEYLHFSNLCRKDKLSESFIENYQQKFNWRELCTYQRLKEEFIRKHINLIDQYDCWYELVMYQKLSEKFIKDFNHKLDLELVYVYQNNLTKEFYDEIRDKYLYIHT